MRGSTAVECLRFEHSFVLGAHCTIKGFSCLVGRVCFLGDGWFAGWRLRFDLNAWTLSLPFWWVLPHVQSVGTLNDG